MSRTVIVTKVKLVQSLKIFIHTDASALEAILPAVHPARPLVVVLLAVMMT